MADYYPVLTRAIAALENNTADARRAVYERARQAIVKQLRSYDPPLSESEITRERLGLEEAVRRIESENRAAQQPPKPPPISARTSPPVGPPLSAAPQVGPSAPPPPPPRSQATPVAPPLAPPLPPSARTMGGDGLYKVHAAAAAAASLGAATANAQAAAGATKAAFDPPPRPAAPPRVEPNFERPRVPGPLPERRPDPAVAGLPPDPQFEDPNPHLREPQEEDSDLVDAPRGPKIGGLVAIVVLLGLGIGAYLARDQIAGVLGVEPPSAVTDSGPKIDDRVSETAPPPSVVQDTAPPPVASAPSEPAPVPPPSADAGSLVSQRAILYDEAPDQKGGASFNGAVNWRTEPVPNKPDQIQLVGEATVAERGLTAIITMTRNVDETLSASHLIEIRFDTTDAFQNGGIANVPGILFKPSEEAGGSALKGMSVKVTKNLFWIGLEKAAADREQNMQAIRSRGWIDLPILYENGRRAVLTLEKGPPGERAFETAFSTWDAEATATPAAQPEAPAPAPVLPP